MLVKFGISNFKSYHEEVSLPLGQLTVLIGANASGKSNLLEGLRLLSWLAQGERLPNLQRAIDSGILALRGTPPYFAYNNDANFKLNCTIKSDDCAEYRFDQTISRRDGDLHISSERITALSSPESPFYILKTPSKGLNSDVTVKYKNFSRGANPEITCTDQMAIFTQLDKPTSFWQDDTESQKKIPQIVKVHQKTLGNILFLDPIPQKMRGYSPVSDHRLRGDGSNISSVLLRLCGYRNKKQRSLFIDDEESNRTSVMDFIRSLPEQNIYNIDFIETRRSEVMLELEETFGGKDRKYEAAVLSDGTLRVLAIAAALLSAPSGSLVVIEEIDNGVHPSRARHLMKQIQKVANERSLQILISTHNPALLDALPDDAVPNVVFCYRDPGDGSSKLVRLQDIPRYPELLAQGTLGDLSTSGRLDQFVKNQPSDEERQQNNLKWLKKTFGEVVP